MLSITSPVFWKFIDWSTVTLEGAFLFAMFWLPAMRFVCALACLFHAFIYYSMDILFFANLAAYASLVDFRLLLRFRPARILLRRFDHLLHSVRLLPLAGLAALLYGIDIAGGNPEWRSNVALDSSASFLALVIGVSSLVYLSLRGMDRLLWDISFPLRGKTLIVLYDGECGLCDAWVQFVLKHDGKKSFQFASLQSDLGRRLAGTGDGKTADLSSVVLWIDGTTYRRSDAICIILRQFGFPWSTLGAMGFIPAFLRIAGYDFVAARRHKWFPPPASCRVPTREDKPRFLS
jgi:predicted DCC family thiol-disulfide oxidoreductase YuxK